MSTPPRACMVFSVPEGRTSRDRCGRLGHTQCRHQLQLV
jgi:hypothetical protein